MKNDNLCEKCFIVVHQNYEERTDACAYRTEQDARKSVEEDVDLVTDELIAAGYEPHILRDTFKNPSIYVSGSDIYYEWQIIETTIE